MIRSSRYFGLCREKAVGVSFYRRNNEPVFELWAERNNNFPVSFTGFSRHRERVSGSLPRTRECGFIPNLGGTTDFCTVRPKLMSVSLGRFLVCGK